MKRTFFLVVLFALGLCPPASGQNSSPADSKGNRAVGVFSSSGDKFFHLDVGGGPSQVKLHSGNQTYQTSDNSDVDFEPQYFEDGKGNMYHGEILVGFIGVEYLQGTYDYDVKVPASALADSAKTETGSGTLKMTGYGLKFHLRRQLGGAFIGVGRMKLDETITTSGEKFKTGSTENYVKYGAEVIFGLVILQVNYIVAKLGEHTARASSIEALIHF